MSFAPPNPRFADKITVRPVTLADCEDVPARFDGNYMPRPPIKATPWRWRDPASIPPREWIYGRHYIRKFLSATVAPGGIGKSSLSIVEALSIVSGRDLLDNNKVIRPGRVWLFNGEDPQDELDRRIATACLFYHIPPDTLDGRLFVDSGRKTEIVLVSGARDGAVIAEPVMEQVLATIHENKIDVMIVDPFVSTHRVGENDNMAIDMVAKTWAKIADETNSAIELVHHTRKSSPAGNSEPSADDARGASALVNAARSVRILNRMSADDGQKAGVENHRLFFSVEPGKQNLSPPSEDRVWRQLIGEGLGNGNVERPEDLVAVVASWKWPDIIGDILPGDLRRVQAAVADGTWKESSQADAWVGKAIAAVLELDPTDAQAKGKIKSLLKGWIKGGVLKVVHKRDERRRECPFIEVGEWDDVQ